MELLTTNYLPGDQRLIEQIVRELKSQGIFDQFRKECISDVDTKPAYQNLRQRVEGSVAGFLTTQTWNPEMNKNQVREMLRKSIFESGFLETGVERIVDQVVNPKITTVFHPKVEEVVYKFLGIEKPVKANKEFSTSLKINTFHDLLPKDLEAVSPEMPEEKEVKVEDDSVKMEDVSPSFEFSSEKNERLQEENSVDSQLSVLSEIVNQDSNQSQKQDSLMSLNSSENTSENTPKMESDDVFISQKSSDSNSKCDLQIDERMDEPETKNIEIESEKLSLPSEKQVLVSEETASSNEKHSADTGSKSKDSSNKKRERYHSSSDKSKSKTERDKDKSRSDKYKREENESSKEQKCEKEKYRIPKLSDKTRTEKDTKPKEKDSRSRDKDKEKDTKIDQDRKSDKDRKSSKHSSEKDKSKNESKSKRESKSDKKDDKGDRKDSTRNDKSKDDRRSSSSSSKKRDSSSSKDRHKDKSKESSSKKNEEKVEKNKNGHSSSNSKRDSSKHKRDEDRSKSAHKKDDKDDKKKKRSSKEDSCSSGDKKNGRRSSDRDSDGPCNSKKVPTTPQKNSGRSSSQKSKQESLSSNIESSTGDSGNSDKIEEENHVSLHLGTQIKLPKFASNLQEAMKIMKMRKQLKKLETMKKLNLDDSEVKKLLTDIAEFSKDGKQEKTDKNIIINDEHLDVKSEKNQEESLNINDFISSSNISMDKWNALESKFMEELGGMNYDSYESPYMDEEESNLMEHEDKYENLQEKMEKILKDANKKEEKVTDTEKSLTEINNPIGQGTKESEDEIVFLESCVERIEEMNTRNISDGAVEGRKLQKEKMFSVPSAVNIEEKVEKTAEIENFENIAQDVEVTIQNIGETNENIEELTMDVEETNENNDAITENIVENILIEETTENIEEITENIEEITENCDEITENFEITEDVEVTIGNVEGISESLEIIENVTINSKEKSDNTEEKQINPVGNVENAKDNIEKTNMNSESKTNKHIPEGERQTEKELEQIELITDNPSIEEFNELHLNADQNRKNQHALILESSETEQVSLEHKLVFPESHSSKSCQTKRRDSKSPIKPMEADFKRKIIVLLEKHSLTEEMIQRRKNGEHSVESNLADIEVELSTKGKSVEVLEIEKENIQSNKIMLLDNIGLEGESTSLKISGQNHVNNRCRKTLLDNKYEVYAEKVESSRENYDKTRTDITNEEMFHRNITNNCESGSKEEDLCCSLESTHNERGLFILRTLIKSIEDNISQSSKKNYSIDLSQAENTHTRKRKLNEDRCDISNNNLDDTVSKKLRIKNTSTTLVPNKTVSTSKKKKIEERKEIPDISSEENFVLPLSPAESEPCIEQKRDAEIVQTPSRRQSGLKSDDSRKKDEISLVTKKSTVCKNNTENKNSAKQRYSSEDLYKPRMLLRRSAKGSKNS